MAFSKKTWKDRISEFPTRRKLTKGNGTTETVTVERLEGTVSQAGDAFSADNMNDLEQRIADEFSSVNSDLDDIKVKLIASVTADGVKSRKDLLDELHALAYPITNYVLGRTEFRRGNTTFLLTDNTTSGYTFEASEVSSSHFNAFNVIMKTNASIFSKWEMTTSGNTYTDSSATIEQSGTVFAIYN